LTISELLTTLRELDVKIWAEGEQIRVSSPKGTLPPELRQTIKELKPELLAVLRASQAAASVAQTSIPPAPRDGALVLSSAQQRMWFLDQLEGGGSSYNIVAANRLRGPLELATMEAALTELVRRHETLRTNIRLENGQPLQVIAPPAPWYLRTVDLQMLDPVERQSRIIEIIAQESACPFDLANDLLLRALIIKAAPDEHVVVIVMHHIISDAASLQVMQVELDVLYRAFQQGQPSPLPDLPIQYADYAAWQQSTLNTPELQRQLAYWTRQLAGNLPVLELPTDLHRDASDHRGALAHQAAWQTTVLPRALSAQLVALAQAEQTTLFMVILSAFDLLLHRLSGQEDILVGTPIAGRNHSGLDQLIGLFLNTLVLRTDLSGNPTFRELLHRVQDVTLGAYSNQDVPFERLVEELQPDRSLNRNPFFDVLINFTSQVDKNFDPDAVGWELRSANAQDAKLPITFYIEQYRQDIGLRFLFQQATYSPHRMVALLDQLETLLQQIVADPAQPISTYTLVSPSAAALLPDPLQTLPEPVYEPAMQTLLRWADESPDLPALVQGDVCWSYAQLGACARQLASSLVALGCGRGDVVAVTGTRSPALIGGMVATMLCGGVLLTLDPVLPPLRQRTMLAEAKARWLLAVGDDLPATGPANELGLAVLSVDPATGRLREPVEAGTAAASLPQVEPNDPAYIFFTSGTTNVPKGVLGIHKGLSHFLHWQRTTFAVGPGDRSAQLTGLSFDVVLRDIFLPLTSGATLYLPVENYLVGSSRAIQWMDDNGITVLHTVPGIVQTWLVDPPVGARLNNMRWVFFAGEPLSEALVQAWRTTFSAATNIVNLYGPTETTLAKFYYQAPQNLLVGVQPVGQPQPSTQALVLRPGNALCGIGEAGEIVIRTPFHSLGYINAPEEQALRFVPNPFSNDPQDLVYFTGDRGRYRPDGMLDILGRLDDQVKINGVRIELGELTAALLDHPHVKSGVVIARKNDEQQYELAAYAVIDPGETLAAAVLRNHFAERFPAAMVPRSYVFA
jgi:amino acid adenylation domain-containing protein